MNVLNYLVKYSYPPFRLIKYFVSPEADTIPHILAGFQIAKKHIHFPGNRQLIDYLNTVSNYKGEVSRMAVEVLNKLAIKKLEGSLLSALKSDNIVDAASALKDITEKAKEGELTIDVIMCVIPPILIQINNKPNVEMALTAICTSMCCSLLF